MPKLSDYRKEREEFWRKGGAVWAVKPQYIQEHVDRDQLAAEAAGVAWDLEEEPLPARLERSGTPFVWCDEVGKYALDLSVHPSEEYPLASREEAIPKEAFRRYNLIPELERLAERLNGALSYPGGIVVIHREITKILESGK